jgi:hypothetical protein
MKKVIILISYSLCILTTSNAFAGRYDNEMKVIEKNSSDFVAVNEKKLADLSAIISAWTKLDEYSSELTALIKIHIKTVNKNANASVQKLQAYNDEKIYVENTLAGIAVLKPKMLASAANITNLLDAVPVVKQKSLQKLENILAELKDLESTFNSRKIQVDGNLVAWRAWQMDIAREAEVKNNYSVMSSLEVVKTLDQVNGALSILNLNFLIAIKNRDYAEAENILQGHSWLKSIFPFFFADKITNQDQSDLLNQIIENAEVEQLKMTRTLEKIVEKPMSPKSGIY